MFKPIFVKQQLGLNNENWVLIVKFVSIIASIISMTTIERLKYNSVTFEPAYALTFEKFIAL